MFRCAFCLIFLALCPVVAQAHAFPERSIPRVGRSLAQSPPEVKITFDADLEPLFSSIVVKNANQIVVSDAASTVSPTNPRVLSAPLKSLAPGKYYIYWGVVATDGHRTEGHFPFRIR